MLEIGGVFVFCAVLVVPALEPDEAGDFDGAVFEGGEGGAGGGAGAADFFEHFPIGCAVFLLDVFEDGEGILAGMLFVFPGDPCAGLFEFLGDEVGGEAGGGRAELFEEGVAAPCGFDEEDGFGEVVAHHGAEFEFGSGAARGTEAKGERAFAFEELDEDVVALDPLVVFAEMGEEVFGFGVGGLMVEQGVGCFAFHVGLACEEEDLNWRFCGGERGGGDDEERE